VSVIKDNREFNFELFNNEFTRNSRALYEDVAILIAKKNDAVEEVYEVREKNKELEHKKAKLKKELL